MTAQDSYHTVAGDQQHRHWSLLMNHPEDLYAFVKLSSHRGFASPLPQCRVHLIVFAHMKQLRMTLSRLKVLPSEIFIWHEMDYWGESRHSCPMDKMKDRMSVLAAIDSNQPVVIATTALALLEKTISSAQFMDHRLELSEGDTIHPDQLREQLKHQGYVSSDHVGGYGTYSQNDRSFHICPPGEVGPLKLKLSGHNTIMAIEPSAASHRGSGSLSSYKIYPASETVISDPQLREQGAQMLYENLLAQNAKPRQCSTMLDHFHKHESFAGYFKLAPLLRKGAGQEDSTLLDHLIREARDDFFVWNVMNQQQKHQVIAQGRSRADQGYEFEKSSAEPTLHPQEYFVGRDQVDDYIEKYGYQAVLYSENQSSHQDGRLGLSQLSSSDSCSEGHSPVVMRDYLRSLMRPGASVHQNVDGSRISQGYSSITEFLTQLSEGRHDLSSLPSHSSDTKVVLMCESKSMMSGWQALLEEEQVSVTESPWNIKQIISLSTPLVLAVGSLRRDYYLVTENIHYVPAQRLGSSRSSSLSARDSQWQDYLRSLSDITSGDLVVHRHHGVGRYLGLVDLGVHGGAAECLKIEYKGGDKIYVPIDHLSYLQKHSSSSHSADESSESSWTDRIKLDSLSKKSAWKKRSSRVKKSVEDLAEEILKVHSRRKLAQKTPYGPPSAHYHEFVSAFPYVETDDQLKFCQDMEQDLTTEGTMDRLLIGDVGFGKTEMAMRAAMRSVLEGYQVMVLCPTTVLCYQHVRTFQTRMGPCSIQVAGAHRFVKSAPLQKIIKDFVSGACQILIGTHKILGSAFRPHKLGLVIIDEEQRFGVSHKEKIKKLKAEAAVLALSATPIPRTMHMSMLGLRDISLLTIAPQGRMAVKNMVSSWDDQLVSQAIRFEIRRGGQVFCVHNRVRDLETLRSQIQSLVPELEIRVAHGQMNEVDLEQVVLAFSRNEFPVLICTSIMESGVDMPNVNTLIVNKSEHFGLSQLYQLRGRVGRSSVQGYAYFMTGVKSSMTPDATRRLQVMMTYQALGSGFSIASYDMDLRGVGDLLGEEQSGHVATVGLEMYTSLLEEALRKARGQQALEQPDCEIHLKVSYGLDKEYIPSDDVRLRFYKKLFQLKSDQTADELAAEMIQDYGALSEKASTLVQVALVRLKLRLVGGRSICEEPAGLYRIEISKLPDDTVEAVLQAIRNHPQTYAFADATHITINLTSYSTVKRLALLPHKISLLAGESNPSDII